MEEEWTDVSLLSCSPNFEALGDLRELLLTSTCPLRFLLLLFSISFAVPLSSFLPNSLVDLPIPSPPSPSSPPVAQVDIILVSSPSQVAFQSFLLSFSGLSLLLSLPLHKLTRRQIIFSHGSLTLVHNFPNPPDSVELFGTSTTVPLPSLELSLSNDVEETCRFFGLDFSRWNEIQSQGEQAVEADLFNWVLGKEDGLLRKGWERVMEASEILDVSTNNDPLLNLVSKDPSRSRKTNSKQRTKLKIPLFQAFLRWLQTHPLPPANTSPTPIPSSSQPPTPLPPPFSLLQPTTFLILQSFPSKEDLYVSTLTERQSEIDALLLRRRTNLALSGKKICRWFPNIDPGQVSSVTDAVRLKARGLDEGGDGWLGAEGRKEEEVKELAVECWEKVKRERELKESSVDRVDLGIS